MADPHGFLEVDKAETPTRPVYERVNDWREVYADSDPLIEFLIERLPEGEVSEFLADIAEVGDVLELRGPIGRWFTWDTRTPAICLVGGTGVVPAVAMTRAARRVGNSDLLRVVAVGRSPDELPYSDELTRSGATIMYTRAASQTRQPGPPTADELGPLLSGSETAYVCGSSRFAEFAEALLIGCGFSPQAIRVEQFGATH